MKLASLRLCIGIFFVALFVEVAQAQFIAERLRAGFREVGRKAHVRVKPPAGKDAQMECLARELDWLEAHIDKFGSVVAKQPDVWGESRLTKYRGEYESEMAEQLDTFQVIDNARITRSDVAFLASATGISNAVGAATGSPINVNNSTGSSTTEADAPGINQSINLTSPTAPAAAELLTAGGNLEHTERLNQRSRFLNHLHQLRRINSGDDTSDAPGYALNLVRIPISINPGMVTRRGYGAKATITATPRLSETLLPETFHSLVINDLVDQLALPILRMSEDNKLPFARAAQQFKARYDAVIKRALQYLKLNSDIEIEAALEAVFKKGTPAKNVDSAKAMAVDAVRALRVRLKHEELPSNEIAEVKLRIVDIEESIKSVEGLIATSLERKLPSDVETYVAGRMEYRTLLVPSDKANKQEVKEKLRNISVEFPKLVNKIAEGYDEQKIGVNPVSRRRRSSMPIPSVLVEDVIDRQVMIIIADAFATSYSGRMVAWNENSPGAHRVHLMDVRHYLQSNMESAYRMVSSPHNMQIVSSIIDQGVDGRGLAKAVEEGRTEAVRAMREDFMVRIDPNSAASNGLGTRPSVAPIMRSLAWPIVVEMALLNEQLNRDVHDIVATRGDCGCHPDRRHCYYLPVPESNHSQAWDGEFAAATEQFQNYVRCRWPIHVFHVDPVADDQNVQESSSLSRELAVAVAVGVASGTVSLRQANNFTRQYREDINAIGLNRTVSGFSHGNDTFGWTFRPRVQTHKNRSTSQAFGETLFGRRADANAREAMLEPGMRECTAIVLMPSFVPYCDFETSTSWFRLDNPRNKELSNHTQLKLSRSIKYMQTCALDCASCSHLYRDGETERLLRRVKQLEHELPMQSMRVQIPYENTLGGFEMFSNGVTDLAPELVGWYGAPGISSEACCPSSCSSAATTSTAAVSTATAAATTTTNTTTADSPATTDAQASAKETAAGTTLFLVGDNFSVHETKIIAGGVAIPEKDIHMISRQVFQVTVPSCARAVKFDGRDYIAIYASTPYGVTSHLHVPVALAKATVAATELAKVAESVKKLEATVSPQKFTWATSSALPIVTSFESVNVIAGAVGQQAEVNRGSVVAGVTKQPFELTWNRLPADMAAGVLPHLTRPAGLIGRFVIGKNEFDTFWIATPGAFDVQSQSKWATDSDALVLALTNAIKTQLTLEKTGKEDSLEVKLKTWVVASQFTLNDQLNTNPSALMFSNPVATDKDLTIQLIRRVLPCESEQCIAIPRLESDVEIPALPETPQAESVVVPTDQSSAPSPTLNRTARATVNVVRDNADGFSHRRVRTR